MAKGVFTGKVFSKLRVTTACIHVAVIITCLFLSVMGKADSMVHGCAYYGIDVEVSSVSYEISVKLVIGFDIDTLDHIAVFLLTDGAEIGSLLLVKSGVSDPIVWKRSGADTLRVDLSELAGLKRAYLQFKYRLPPDTLDNGDIMLRREERWYPILSAVPARYRISFKAPGRYHVFSSGQKVFTELEHGRAKGVWIKDRPTYTMPIYFMDTSRVRVFSREASGVTVAYHARLADDSTAEAILDQCLQSLNHYNAILGPYPYSELSLVDVPGFRAVQSLATLMLIGQMFVQYYWHEGWGNWPAHEVAHQWIGHIVLTNKLGARPGRLFVEESLAEYLRIDFIRSVFGEDSAKAVLQQYQTKVDEIADDAVDLSLYNLSLQGRIKGIMINKQGPLVWHRLRTELGESHWNELLHQISEQYYFKYFDYDALRLTLLQVSNDSSVVALFDSLVGCELSLQTTESDR